MDIAQVTAFLYSLKPRGIRFGLENTRLVLEQLGRPQDSFAVVHIAGSNGKGSTAAFVAELLRAAGRRVGLYTSPHLEHYRERFRVDGRPVADEQVVAAFERLLAGGLELDPVEISTWVEREGLTGKMAAGSWYRLRGAASRFCRLTFFECTTIMATEIFARAGVEVAVMECGMGGRLDATNVFMPVVSVITPVSLEHTEWLGDTLEQVAGEKAGIIKEGIPVVSGRQFPPAAAVIERQARERGAPLHRLGEDFSCSGDWRRARIKVGQLEVGPLELGLCGRHQLDNAACALAALVFSRGALWHPRVEQIRRGLAATSWPARFERLGPEGGWVVDGAHNPHGVDMLVRTFTEVFGPRPVPVVFGVLGEKNAAPMLRRLETLASRFELATPADARGRQAGQLLAYLRRPARAHESISAALQQLRREGAGRVLVCGSLTVAAEARRWLMEQKW
ncbi:MAG: bifunctional folylpolyglutamate synthase/dihydrofolate synthase [Deltaproteobacteria bacterium]|nr:MAG: bifunctional folylpolyglutamate synthase/dihydrofolate synthase [Deltaproteobacteria bacterium]